MRALDCLLVVASLMPMTASMDVFSQSQPLDASLLFERLEPSLCSVMALDSLGREHGFGSGFVLRDSLVVTNRHVVANAASVRVECNRERGRAIRVVRFSKEVDLVVLETTLQKAMSIQYSFEDREIKLGSVVFALGNPYGPSSTITTGLASGVRTFRGVEYLQVSAEINPGNSGGPIVDSNGRLVAIATMGLKGAQGLNFGIPVRYLSSLAEVSISFSDLPEDEVEETDKLAVSRLAFRGLPLGSP